MSENKDNNSVIVEPKPALFPLKEPKTLDGRVAADDAEVHKGSQVQESQSKVEAKSLARQLKEAGSSTNSSKVIINQVSRRASKDSPLHQTNPSNPANQTLDDGDRDENEIKSAEKAKNEDNGSQDSSKKPVLGKTRSSVECSAELGEGFLKNSTKSNSLNQQTIKSVDVSMEPSQNEELPQNKESNSSQSFTGSAGEEVAVRRKGLQKQASSNSVIKSRRAESRQIKAQERKSPENAASEHPNQMPRVKISKAKAEEICLKWIKSLNEIETEGNMENNNGGSDKNMPEFCSNRICPISEGKIQQTSKVMRQLKKVTLRKVQLSNDYIDEQRWYCLKCLNANKLSQYCLYCCQIYFNEDEGCEDDGKVWICCDDCEKWIHLQCDIQRGNNTELKEQDLNEDNYQYSCPQCRYKSVKKRDAKAESRKNSKNSAKSTLERNRKAKADNNCSSYSNSQDNDSQKAKNMEYENDVHMAPEASPNDEEMREDSYVYSNENSKKEAADQPRRQYSDTPKEGRRSIRTRKIKESKNSKSKATKNRKKLKRTHEEYAINDYRDKRDSIEEFTLYRSLKIAKEREDIIETRLLANKVQTFCGLTPSQITERVEKDLEIIRQSIERGVEFNGNGTYRSSNRDDNSESEALSGSPQKDQERGAMRGTSSFKNGNSSFTGNSENGYGKSLRPRRNRSAKTKQY